MLLVTSAQMQNMDRNTTKNGYIPGLLLMERAATGLLKASLEILKNKKSPRVAVFCGKGNNGGDGFALARLLKTKRIRAECFLCADPLRIKGDALTNFSKLKKLKIPVSVIKTTDNLPSLLSFHLVVDALLGTGFSGEIQGVLCDIIEHINQFTGPILAVDAPTGANVNTGEVVKPCVHATTTVTFGLPKIGQWFYPCRNFTGKLIVHDLDFPKQVMETENIRVELIEHDWAKNVLPRRKKDGHKGDFGKVLIIAGSKGFSGAAILAGKAALRTGAGMVLIAGPACIQSIIAAALPEAVTLSLDETKQGAISLSCEKVIMDKIKTWADIVVIGPGLNLFEETSELTRRIVKSVPKPMVVDADALNAFQGKTSELCNIPFPRILTPHAGEMNRLWEIDPEKNGFNKIEWLKNIAAHEFKNTILLKGAPTLIAAAGNFCFVNSSGNSGMATAGSGDVLSGVIAALLAQGNSPQKAAALGAYLHGLSGDLAIQDLSEYGLIASDLIDYLPNAFLSLKA
jgi:NAD(P)H-hydrate epimerase